MAQGQLQIILYIPGVSSHGSPYQPLCDISRANLLIAMLYFSYLRKPWKTNGTSRVYHPAGLRLDHTAANWIPPPPHPCSGNHWGIHRPMMLQHIWSVIGGWFGKCACTQQQGSDSWISLWLQLQAHINASIFVMPTEEISEKSKTCKVLPCDLTSETLHKIWHLAKHFLHFPGRKKKVVDLNTTMKCRQILLRKCSCGLYLREKSLVNSQLRWWLALIFKNQPRFLWRTLMEQVVA